MANFGSLNLDYRMKNQKDSKVSIKIKLIPKLDQSQFSLINKDYDQ